MWPPARFQAGRLLLPHRSAPRQDPSGSPVGARAWALTARPPPCPGCATGARSVIFMFGLKAEYEWRAVLPQSRAQEPKGAPFPVPRRRTGFAWGQEQALVRRQADPRASGRARSPVRWTAVYRRGRGRCTGGDPCGTDPAALFTRCRTAGRYAVVFDHGRGVGGAGPCGAWATGSGVGPPGRRWCRSAPPATARPCRTTRQRKPGAVSHSPAR